jgi:hypothetical protein
LHTICSSPERLRRILAVRRKFRARGYFRAGSIPACASTAAAAGPVRCARRARAAPVLPPEPACAIAPNGVSSRAMDEPDRKPANRLAVFAVGTMGWVIGTLLAWLNSPLYKHCQTLFPGRSLECRRALYGWIPRFALYWPWPILGAAVFAAAFVLALRLRRAKPDDGRSRD